MHSGLDTGPIVQGAIRIDGELVLKRFVARNVKPITPIVWNQTIGDELFSEIEGGVLVPIRFASEASSALIKRFRNRTLHCGL